MEVLKFSFDAVVPVIGCAGLGWFLRGRGMAGEEFIRSLNKILFQVFFPIMLFNNIYPIDFGMQFNPGLVLYAAAVILLVMLALVLILPRFIGDKSKLAVTINATFRSNYIIYATPIITNMFGEEGRRVAATLTPVAVCLFNFLAVILMCYYSGDMKQSKGKLIAHTFRDVARHPLIIASALGVVVALFRIPIPDFLRNTVSYLGAVGSPMGLVLLGMQLDLRTMRDNFLPLLGVSSIRLLAVPLLGILPAIALGFRGVELGALFMLFGTPSPVTSAIMARNYNMAPVYAAQLVVVTTVLSSGTIFAGIFIMRALGLI